jgi:hypothetical protein
MSTYPLLSLAIWIPIFAGLVVLATGSIGMPRWRDACPSRGDCRLSCDHPLMDGFDMPMAACSSSN